MAPGLRVGSYPIQSGATNRDRGNGTTRKAWVIRPGVATGPPTWDWQSWVGLNMPDSYDFRLSLFSLDVDGGRAIFCRSEFVLKVGEVSHNQYLALVGRVLGAAETARDEPGGLSLQDLALKTGYVENCAPGIQQCLKRRAFAAPSVLDSRVRVRLSIPVGAPKARFPYPFAEDTASYLVDACRRLSEKLDETGFVHPHHGEFTLIEDTNQPFHLSKEG